MDRTRARGRTQPALALLARRDPPDIAAARIADGRGVATGEFAAGHLAATVGVGDRPAAVARDDKKALTAQGL